MDEFRNNYDFQTLEDGDFEGIHRFRIKYLIFAIMAFTLFTFTPNILIRTLNIDFFLLYTLTYITIILVLTLLAVKIFHFNIKSIFVLNKKPMELFRDFADSLSLYFIGLFILIVIALILKHMPLKYEFDQDSETVVKLVPLYFSAIIAPIAEEVIFRGIILNSVNKIVSKNTALIIVSLIFFAVHLTDNPSIAVNSIIFGLVFLITGNIFASILTHSLNNTLVYILNNSINNDTNSEIIGFTLLAAIVVSLVYLFINRKRLKTKFKAFRSIKFLYPEKPSKIN